MSKLVFVHKVGKDYNDDIIYQFIFTNNKNIADVKGEDWDEFPSGGDPGLPYKQYINKVGTLHSEVPFELIQDNESFFMWDAVDGLISLAWEDISEYEEYPDNRVYFKYGEDIKDVEQKLLSRELKLVYNEK